MAAGFSSWIVDVAVALDIVLGSAVDATFSAAGAILLLDEQQRLQPIAARGLRPGELEPLSAILEGVILERSDADDSPISGQLQSEREDESLRGWRMLAIGLPEPVTPPGMMLLLREYDGPSFNDAAEARLSFFSLSVSALCQNARPHREPAAAPSASEDIQTTFVSIVSHELQTPVAIIKGYAGTLSRPDATWSPATVQRVASTIEAECDRLTRLITDLLDLARIQAGRVAMTFRPVDPVDLLREAVERARTQAPERQIVIEPVDTLPIVRGDHDKLRMALRNLVDNAVKYSPPGSSIIVGGSAREQELWLWVRDQGIGVPAEERERIFDRFHRIDTSLSRDTPGVGMGLYICKVIVEAHSGRVWVDSEGPGRGSTFYIALPLVAA